jgi:tetratricopeptide (TPR) repeat protein
MRTLELARKLADRQIQFLALRILALTQVYLPDYREEAIKSSDEALTIVREFGHPTWELEILHTAGHIANIVGHHQAAIDMSSQALELRQKLGMTFNEADWLGIVGDAHQGLGRYQEAAEAFSTALPIFRDNFQQRHQALCLLKLGCAYQAMGDYRRAIASAEESLPIFRELQLTHYEQQALQTIKNCQRQQPTTPASRATSL